MLVAEIAAGDEHRVKDSLAAARTATAGDREGDWHCRGRYSENMKSFCLGIAAFGNATNYFSPRGYQFKNVAFSM